MLSMFFSCLRAQCMLLFMGVANLYRSLLTRNLARLHPLDSSRPSTPAAPVQEVDDAMTSSDISSAEIEREVQNFFPPTEQQIDDATRKFVDSVDRAAVCDVASKHLAGGARACHIVDEKRGGFNACFFVRFDSDENMWVLRIPLAPLVRNAWRKLQSEVTTMRYIASQTSIRVPRVQSYGKDDTLVKGTSTPFIIMEHVPGKPLDARTWLHTTKPQRENVYMGLTNVLKQLRKLEFSTAGSLMPNPDDESNPVVGPFLSLTANEFERNEGSPSTASLLTTARQFLDYHFKLLSDTYKQPVQELDDVQAKMEIFAVDSLLKKIPKHIDLDQPGPTFVLVHPDLRCDNIIIDDDFNIVAVIDWEFTGTVPLQMFAPPPWIMGFGIRNMVTGIHRKDIFPEFRTCIVDMAKSSNACAQLCQEWGLQEGQDQGCLSLVSPLFHLLRSPCSLMDVYYPYIFPQLFGPEACKETIVNDFFLNDENQAVAQRLELLINKSNRYTEYLRSNGLIFESEHERIVREFWERDKAWVEANGEKTWCTARGQSADETFSTSSISD